MNGRNWLAAVMLGLVVLIVAILLYPVRRDETVAPPVPEEAGAQRPAAQPESDWIDPLAGRVGQGLNAPGGTARGDLLIVHGLLEAWRSNARGHGNPSGTNREITAVLTGHNPWKLVVIPSGHPAINAAGELCDRWGTPLFFHQLGAERMELRSSGPDRERFTADDVGVTP